MDGLNLQGRIHAKKDIEMLLNEPMFNENKPIYQSHKRILKLYNAPVSAGTGLFLDSEDYDEIQVDNTVPQNASYAVRVSGDSMLPRFVDGQIIFIKEQTLLENGEIGIFSLYGKAYFKKLIGNKLISLNPMYPPIQLHEFNDLRVFGKVVGQEK